MPKLHLAKKSPRHSLWRCFERTPQIPLSLLLITQTTTLLISPTLQKSGSIAGFVFTLLIIINMILVIGPLTRRKPIVRLVLEISGSGLLVSAILASVHPDSEWMLYLTLGFILAFQLNMMVMLILHLFLPVKQQEKLLAAVNFYLLTGITFSYLYLTINIANPLAFNIPTQTNIASWPDYLYFSFVTLTSLGYGDILPLSNLAQSLVCIEVVIGVLSPTIMIARFVSPNATPVEPPTPSSDET